MTGVTIAKHGELFCIPCGNGFTFLGFDVARDRTKRLASWLNRPDLMPAAPRGTIDSYMEYTAVLDIARIECEKTGRRCPVELTPQLIGLEGNRVEVHSHGETRRFYVGKSTGWLPCHLEILTRRSSGGAAAMGPYDSIQVIGVR